MRSTTNPALLKAWMTRRPLTTGNCPPAMLGGHGHAADLGLRVGRDRDPVLATVGEDRADGFLRIGQRFVLGITLGYDLRKGGNEHCETTTLLRLENYREAEVFRHQICSVTYFERTL